MKSYDFKSKKPNLLKVEYSVAPFSSVERRKTSKFDKFSNINEKQNKYFSYNLENGASFLKI